LSKISLQPNASGTGTFTLAAPDSNTNRTLTLPDEAGSVLTDVSDLAAANLTGDVAADRITGALNATGSAPIYACRAWVSFNGETNPITIFDSGNVSSITDDGTGLYVISMTTAMNSTNYAIVSGNSGDGDGNNRIFCEDHNRFTKSTTQFRMKSSGTGGAIVDIARGYVAVFE